MTIELKQVDLRQAPIRTRMPFRYGIATLTEAPYLLVFADFEVDGKTTRGVSADILPPKWFTKEPDAALEDELADMVTVIGRAVESSLAIGEEPSTYRWWKELSKRQSADPTIQRHPPLLKGFGVSLLERAAIDATCHRHETPLHAALRSNLLGMQLGEHHAELAGSKLDEYLPREPSAKISVRHTIGLADPLTASEIAEADRIDDGLPQSLDQCIARYGLTYFKIKLPADLATARERLTAISRVIEQSGAGCQFTLDGNECFSDPGQFRDFWSELSDVPTIGAFFLRGLLLVEQPFHRDVALSEEVGTVFSNWPNRPPIIIDESDSEVGSFAQALAAGYDGTSHKNCKGVFKGIANACLVAGRKSMHTANERPLQMTGEDLTNIGPVALLQDLAVGAAIGLTHMERNGHHYVAGLRAFPESVQRSVLDRHGDLYVAAGDFSGHGSPRLTIRAGRIALRSVNNSPFGYAAELQPSEFASLGDN